ncbi:hypothetical protein AB1286_16075 [Trinickia sp. NRRL B-1857]|uniref:hypothetical protein n=1 Tax=Trinickia sp. NRRL B-1857 TaxID=3162879 RepID=UPI003D2DE90B
MSYHISFEDDSKGVLGEFAVASVSQRHAQLNATHKTQAAVKSVMPSLPWSMGSPRFRGTAAQYFV